MWSFCNQPYTQECLRVYVQLQSCKHVWVCLLMVCVGRGYGLWICVWLCGVCVCVRAMWPPTYLPHRRDISLDETHPYSSSALDFIQYERLGHHPLSFFSSVCFICLSLFVFISSYPLSSLSSPEIILCSPKKSVSIFFHFHLWLSFSLSLLLHCVSFVQKKIFYHLSFTNRSSTC